MDTPRKTMKAAFSLIPSESRRLIAKAVLEMEIFKRALNRAYVILTGGTTNGYIAQELLKTNTIAPQRFTAGTSSHRLLCVTDPGQREAFPIIFHKGGPSSKSLDAALTDFHIDTVIIKGASAIDPMGNVGVIASGFDGGTMGKTMGTAVSQGLKYIVPVGLEKLIPSVEEAVAVTGAKTLDYSLGADFGMFRIPNAVVVTEIEALRILAGVDTKQVGAGGVGESAGCVVLVARGRQTHVQKAISIIESIKGEPVLPGFKGDCEACRYACKFSGQKPAALPAWLADD